jgi:hypothetical protein
MPHFLEALVGAIVWVVANVVYIDLRRKGERGFGRFISFFAGFPATWLWLFTVPEGHAPRIEPPPDDDDRLLREIRVDRELRERRTPPRLEPRFEPRGGPRPAEESQEPPGS